MKITCPHCNRKLIAPDGIAGKQVKCPSCAKPFILPLPQINSPDVKPLPVVTQSALPSQPAQSNSPAKLNPSAQQPLKQDTENVSVEFAGSALGTFGRIFLASIVSIFVIPAPWMMVWLYRWGVGKLRLSDNTQVSFSGLGGQIWFPIMTLLVLRLAGQFIPFFALLIIPLNCFLSLIIIRWFWRNLVLSCGTKVSFTGSYLPYLGWSLLSLVSILTIIGWAWVNVAYTKWFLRNLKGDNHIVEFHGNGWNVLWRTVVLFLSCVLIIPIPWTSLWFLRWYLRNISIEKAAA